MAFSLIPKDDPNQALRVRRVLLAIGMALIHLAMCIAMYHQGYFRLRFREFVIFCAAIWTVHLSFLLIIRTGFNRHFRDPSLTFQQIFWTATCVMLTAYFLNGLRPVVLMLFLVGMLFGFLRLSSTQFVWLSVYAGLLYAAVIGLLYGFHPEAVDLRAEVITWFSFSLVTSCFAVMGRVIGQVRRTLHEHNRQLSEEIEERRKAQEQTQFRQAFFEGLVDNLPDAMAIFDDAGMITEINPRFTLMFGWSEEEALGKNISDLVAPPDRQEEAHAYRRRITSGEIVDVETIRMKKDGSLIHVSLRSAPVVIGDRRIGHFVLYRDITPRVRAEEERAGMEARLQESRKMEAIATLAGGIAHQFNNALTTVVGNLDLLEMELRPDHRTRERVGRMKQAAFHMAHLTSQLLAYARGGKYAPATLSFSDFTGETLQLIRHTLNPDVRLETDLPPDAGYVRADPTQMQMVITALVSNSNEAMEVPGNIRVSTRSIELDEAFTGGYPGVKAGPFACLCVQDDGRGMDETTRQKIFEPFFTTHFLGRGLGLSAVYGIVTNHHGIITVDSEPGKGTQVRVYLPAVAPPKQDREAADVEKTRPDLPAGKGTILLIEDEAPVAEIHREIIEGLGYQVLAAATGKEALDIAQNPAIAVDLALLDIKLPDIAGNQLYPLLLKARPGIKVLVCSGYAIDGPAKEILDAGAEGFVQKPFAVATLAEKLKEALVGKKASG